jgi:hypothetical protein
MPSSAVTSMITKLKKTPVVDYKRPDYPVHRACSDISAAAFQIRQQANLTHHPKDM